MTETETPVNEALQDAPAGAKPAVVVTLPGGRADHRYEADGIDMQDGALFVARSPQEEGQEPHLVAVYAKDHWASACEAGAQVPDAAALLAALGVLGSSWELEAAELARQAGEPAGTYPRTPAELRTQAEVYRGTAEDLRRTAEAGR